MIKVKVQMPLKEIARINQKIKKISVKKDSVGMKWKKELKNKINKE